MAITGLLFAIYRQQEAAAPAIPAAAAVEAAPQELMPDISTSLQPLEAPKPVAPIDPTPLVRRPTVKPTPTHARAAEQPAAPKRASTPPPAEEPLAEPEPVAVPPTAKLPEAEPIEPIEPDNPPTPPGARAPGPISKLEPPAGTLQEEIPAVPQPPEPMEASEPVEAREPRVVRLEAGSRLTVRLDSTLSTARNRVDDTFFATLDEPVIVDGLIIADKGARLEGRVVESEQAGRVKGLARLACELSYLHTDDGQRVAIRTSTFALDGPSSRKDDIKKVAIGAGTGALLGAILGGGKGAAIGAASGAGAGAGTAAVTRGDPAVIEPETRLDFRLSDDTTITEKL
ncbi:MAG: hypothetical protein R2748_16255 [Bryobacterales bacterium]